MNKKVVWSVLAAVLLTILISGSAFAAEGDDTGFLKVRGEVIAVDPTAGKFRIEKPDGSVLTFFVNEETNFRGLESLEEMQVGWKSGVAAREDQEGKLWAVLVIAGDPVDLLQVRGKVSDVNTAAGKFSVQTPTGEELRFFVAENTRYAGQITGLEELEIGMGAGVAYRKHSEGKLVAVGLVAGYAPELAKVKGKVTAVDTQLGKFEIETSSGERMRFFVAENTRYQGQLASLDEMQVGWQAGVAAREGEDGSLTAVLVIAGKRPENIRSRGKIVAVDAAAGKFRLEIPDGSVQTFFVTENTSYKGGISSFTELEEGLLAVIAGYEDQEGSLIARVVLAGNFSPERPEIIRARGTLKAVNPGAGKFQLEKSDGSLLTVYGNEETSYRGQAASFTDLEKGMRAGVIGYQDRDGKFIARIVVAGYPGSSTLGGDLPAPGRGLPQETVLGQPLR